jgi:hypothetical protein
MRIELDDETLCALEDLLLYTWESERSSYFDQGKPKDHPYRLANLVWRALPVESEHRRIAKIEEMDRRLSAAFRPLNDNSTAS